MFKGPFRSKTNFSQCRDTIKVGRSQAKQPLFPDNAWKERWNSFLRTSLLRRKMKETKGSVGPQTSCVLREGENPKEKAVLPTLHIHEAVSKAVKITASIGSNRRELNQSVSRVFAVTLKRSITANLTSWWPRDRCRSRRLPFPFTTRPNYSPFDIADTHLYTCIITDTRPQVTQPAVLSKPFD